MDTYPLHGKITGIASVPISRFLITASPLRAECLDPPDTALTDRPARHRIRLASAVSEPASFCPFPKPLASFPADSRASVANPGMRTAFDTARRPDCRCSRSLPAHSEEAEHFPPDDNRFAAYPLPSSGAEKHRCIRKPGNGKMAPCRTAWAPYQVPITDGRTNLRESHRASPVFRYSIEVRSFLPMLIPVVYIGELIRGYHGRD